MIGDEDGMIQYDAYDQDNIARVYGYATTKEKAIEQCKLALKEYLQKRPWYKGKKYTIKERKNSK